MKYLIYCPKYKLYAGELQKDGFQSHTAIEMAHKFNSYDRAKEIANLLTLFIYYAPTKIINYENK